MSNTFYLSFSLRGQDTIILWLTSYDIVMHRWVPEWDDGLWFGLEHGGTLL